MHEERGECNAEGLYSILESIKPDVVFLEASENSFSSRIKTNFKLYKVFDRRLEIKALQIYELKYNYTYVNVLDKDMDERFDAKQNLMEQVPLHKDKLEHLMTQAALLGIEFLNSKKCTDLFQQLLQIEDAVLGQHPIGKAGSLAVDEYENNMLDNVFKFCREVQFENAVLLCGAAHRMSMWGKIQERNLQEELGINLKLFEVAIEVLFI